MMEMVDIVPSGYFSSQDDRAFSDGIVVWRRIEKEWLEMSRHSFQIIAWNYLVLNGKFRGIFSGSRGEGDCSQL